MPANRFFYELESLTKGLVLLAGGFAPAGTGAPTDPRGRGFSVARQAPGHFRVTFEDKYVELVAGIASLMLASASDKSCILGPYDAENRTLDIFVPDISDFVNEVQDIDFDTVPDAGTWTITFGGQTTSSLAFNADATAVEAALEALSNIDDVTVTGNYTAGFTVTFVAPAGPVSAMTVSDTLTTTSNPVAVSIAETTPGVSGADVSANANNLVNFKCWFQNTKLAGA